MLGRPLSVLFVEVLASVLGVLLAICVFFLETLVSHLLSEIIVKVVLIRIYKQKQKNINKVKVVFLGQITIL